MAVSPDQLRSALAELVDEEPDELDPDANLFTLGLESIAVMKLVGAWRRAGLPVSFADLAEQPTLRAWTALLTASPVAEPTPVDEPEPADPLFLLATMQHAYWIGRGDTQHLGAVAAHLYAEFDSSGVDPDRLAAAFEAVVARHGMLRARLTDGEMFAAGLSLLPDGRTRLHLDVDMITADAVSYRILLSDLARGYQGEELPPLEYDYRTYRTARPAVRAAEAEQAAAWWRERYADLPGAPDLPLAPARTTQARVTRRHFVLDPGERARLVTLARARGLTPAAVMATAFAEIVGAWSAEPRFLLNVPLFDREPLHPEVGKLVGRLHQLGHARGRPDREPDLRRARGRGPAPPAHRHGARRLLRRRGAA